MGYTNTVFVQKSKLLNGVLRFSTLGSDFKDFKLIDGYGTLKNRDKLIEFENYLSSNGLKLEFIDNDTEKSYNTLSRCIKTNYEVNSPFLIENHLFPFQNVGLNIVWEQLKTQNPRVLVQWDTGAGKTLLSCLTAQKLFDENRIDKVLVFCKKIKQYDWEQEFKRMTTLDVTRVGSWARKVRHEFYEQDNSQVLVLNYEKVRGPSKIKVKGQRAKVKDYSRTDIQQILDLVKDKRILVVIDEAQKINTGTSL